MEVWKKAAAGIILILLAACSSSSVGDRSSGGSRSPFESTSAKLEQRDQSVAREDLVILRRAAEILVDESAWKREDDRTCQQDAVIWSLFCALEKASIEALGEYQHRRVALQEVRFAIEDVSGGEEFEHRLMDFNNTRTFEEVRRVLAIATERVESRLGEKPAQ